MNQKRQVLSYVLAYILWAISTGLGILVLTKSRETVLLAMVVSSNVGNPTKSQQFYSSLIAAAIDNWSILVIGVLVLILLVGIENLYRMSVPSGKLLKRFFLISGIECGLLFYIHSIYYALSQTFRILNWTAIALPAVEFALAALFLWISYILRSKARKTTVS
jgi:hypothetical protein